MLTLTLTKIKLPPSVITGIVVTLYYKEYYATSYTLLAPNVPINPDGTIQASPPLYFMVDPTHKYMVRAVDQLCDAVYDQAIIINPYCPLGYELSDDSSYCFKEEISSAIPPSAPETLVAVSNNAYGTCGTYIYDPGYSLNGTGTSTLIPLINGFWRNGGSCVDNNSIDGAMNRAGVWSTSTNDNQTIGFAVCLNFDEDTTVYVGLGADNLCMVYLDGVLKISQNEVALNAQYSVGGATFKVFHVYPIDVLAGVKILELVGVNNSGPAAIACEVYNNTSAQIITANTYSALNLIFSSKDYVGHAVQLGSNGRGYSCAPGFALSYCESPIVCRRLTITNVLY